MTHVVLFFRQNIDIQRTLTETLAYSIGPIRTTFAHIENFDAYRFQFSKKSAPFTIANIVQPIDYIVYAVQTVTVVERFCCVYIQGGYKHHLEKTGNFEGGPYKQHFQNRQFDVSLLENFGKKVYIFTIFSKIFDNFSKIHLQGVMNLF